MKAKIITPAGYMYLGDERMTENAKKMFTSIVNYKELVIRNLIEPKAKSYHEVSTSFGRAYARSYGDALKIAKSQTRYRPPKEIEIINVKF